MRWGENSEVERHSDEQKKKKMREEGQREVD